MRCEFSGSVEMFDTWLAWPRKSLIFNRIEATRKLRSGFGLEPIVGKSVFKVAGYPVLAMSKKAHIFIDKALLSVDVPRQLLAKYAKLERRTAYRIIELRM
ncbi:MAG: hypothetical protein ACE5GA_03705 [Candidatus Zixiibacteriota bacterium]